MAYLYNFSFSIPLQVSYCSFMVRVYASMFYMVGSTIQCCDSGTVHSEALMKRKNEQKWTAESLCLDHVQFPKSESSIFFLLNLQPHVEWTCYWFLLYMCSQGLLYYCAYKDSWGGFVLIFFYFTEYLIIYFNISPSFLSFVLFNIHLG